MDFKRFKRKLARKWRRNKFFRGMCIYVMVMLVLAVVAFIYTMNSLKKYEKSLPDVVMNDYIKEFTDMVKDDTIERRIVLPESVEFEEKSKYVNTYVATLDKNGEYSFKRNADSYGNEEVVYDIYNNDKVVARMTIEPGKSHVLLAILTVNDWNIKKIEPVMESFSYTIPVYEGYSVTVNGIPVSEKYLVGTAVANPDFENVSAYTQMPKTVTYKIDNLVNQPVIVVKDPFGNEVECTLDNDKKVATCKYDTAQKMPTDRYNEALSMVKVWENFLTNDLPGAAHGLATVQQYLIKDSYYWNLAKQYSVSPDITFISNHTIKNPPYTDLVVDEYIAYSEDCYSCHIKFTKNMLLSNGNSSTDKIDSTFYFVKMDGKWYIADMIAKTE